jgi:hypothetical protein
MVGGGSGVLESPAANQTFAAGYMGMFQAAPFNRDSDAVEMPVAFNGTMSDFRVRISAPPGGSGPTIRTRNVWTFRFTVNGNGTPIVCAIESAATTCTDLLHSVALTAGQLVSVRVTYLGFAAAPAPPTRFAWVAKYTSG